MEKVLPKEICKATMVDKVEMQLTPDIDVALDEMQRGKTITLSEFRKTFLKWRDIL